MIVKQLKARVCINSALHNLNVRLSRQETSVVLWQNRKSCSQGSAAGRCGCLARWFVSSGIDINAKTEASSAVRCAAVLLTYFLLTIHGKNKTFLSFLLIHIF